LYDSIPVLSATQNYMTGMHHALHLQANRWKGHFLLMPAAVTFLHRRVCDDACSYVCPHVRIMHEFIACWFVALIMLPTDSAAEMTGCFISEPVFTRGSSGLNFPVP
jgi:hypothetical protein